MLEQTKRTIEAMKACGFEHGKEKDFTAHTPFNRKTGSYDPTKVYLRSWNYGVEIYRIVFEKAAELAATGDLDVWGQIWTSERTGRTYYSVVVEEGTGKCDLSDRREVKND